LELAKKQQKISKKTLSSRFNIILLQKIVVFYQKNDGCPHGRNRYFIDLAVFLKKSENNLKKRLD